MTRVKRGNVLRKRHKKVLKMAKGFRGAASVIFSRANQVTMKALRYAFMSRRKKKRDFRRIWITRLNGAVRRYGITYSEFIRDLRSHSIQLNRKVLAQIACIDTSSFIKLMLGFCK
jgi:large subunit ribosomal protein L20